MVQNRALHNEKHKRTFAYPLYLHKEKIIKNCSLVRLKKLEIFKRKKKKRTQSALTSPKEFYLKKCNFKLWLNNTTITNFEISFIDKSTNYQVHYYYYILLHNSNK